MSSEAVMSEAAQAVRRAYAPGTFCWSEVATTDQGAAKRYYTALMGWTVNDVPMGDGSHYTIFRKGGRDVAAAYSLMPEQREQGVPPHVTTYFSVASAGGAAARARELGGEVLAGPFDVMGSGRMAVLRDPTGAVFCVWEARDHVGAAVLGEPGGLGWTELLTPDPEAAAPFYAGLFGWRRDVQVYGEMEYTVFRRGAEAAAGMMRLVPEMGDTPPGWLVYFSVADCDATVERAWELGGRVLMGPDDVPGVGRWALLQDPQGAVSAVIRFEAAG